MATLAANVRLRPIRFGFLVKPGDIANVLEVFRVNTCLWGGAFNPIIPCLRNVPKWWDRHGHHFETASQIIHGYVECFEPDFLVESVPGLAARLDFDPKRVLSLSDMLPREGDRHGHGHGQSVMALYRDRYRKVFQFARRHEHDIVDIVAEDRSLSAAAACLAGGFPEGDALAYYHRAFQDAVQPRTIELNGQKLAELYEGGFTSALRLGHSGIEVDTHGWHDPALFVFDALEPNDLIDVWNLRAVRRHIVPVPVQWLSQLSAFCRKSITANYRPLPDNPHGVMMRQTVMFGRAVGSEAIEGLYNEYLRVDVNGANVRQDWYPAIWQRASTHGPYERRATLIAARKTFNAFPGSRDSELQFDCLHPEWSEEYGGDHRWANVVKIDDWSFRDAVATVFPNYRRQAFVPRLRTGGEHTLSTTEGIVINQCNK